VNAAFSDFLMMAAMFPFMAISNFYETWAFGPLMCELYGFIGSLSGCMSIWSMAMIAFDRYNVIVKGMAGKYHGNHIYEQSQSIDDIWPIITLGNQK
jgi:r-opsin